MQLSGQNTWAPCALQHDMLIGAEVQTSARAHPPTKELLQTRNTFCGTWHLPDSKSTPQRPNCTYINKGYIAYFSLRMREMANFHFRSKI